MDSNNNSAINWNETEPSGYVFDTPNAIAGVPSSEFSNVKLTYTSPNGIFRIFTATRYGKRFLLKSLTDKYAEDPIYNFILSKEFEIGVCLEHPNIRRTIGFENIHGIGNVIILEYIDGETLDKALKSGRINSGNARSVICQLADAIGYLHNKHIFHRDIKPANILVTYSGTQVKLIDFSLSDSESYVVLKNPAGTKNYIAPEQLKPDARPSPQADIYAFGVVARDVATSVNDRELLQMSRTCCKVNPDDRPTSISEIDLPPQKSKRRENRFNLGSQRLTRILMYVISALAVATAIMTYQKFTDKGDGVRHADADSSNVQIVDMEKYNPNQRKTN